MVRFGTPTKDEVVRVRGTTEPVRVAGAFTLDGLGGWFVAGVDGDLSNVVGISLPLVREMLAELGWQGHRPVDRFGWLTARQLTLP